MKACAVWMALKDTAEPGKERQGKHPCVAQEVLTDGGSWAIDSDLKIQSVFFLCVCGSDLTIRVKNI